MRIVVVLPAPLGPMKPKTSPFSSRSYIGVLGPTRQNYGPVIGLVQYTGKLLEEALN